MTTLDEFMGAIRQVESGGNYAHPKNASGASGAYQFIDSTWGGYGGYKSAYLAPPEVQDARARELMQAYYDQFGDWDHVAAAWIGGPGTAAKGSGAWGGISDSNMTVASYVQRVNSVLGHGQSAGAAVASKQATGAVGAAVGAGIPQTLGSKLSGVLDVASGSDSSASYTQKSSAGDSLGERLQAIMGVING